MFSHSKEESIWHGHRLVEIAPDSPVGYASLGGQTWYQTGQIDESIRWESKALKMDPKNPEYPIFMVRAYSALGDPEMALAYLDLARTRVSPDNQSAQNGLLVTQAIIRLVAGQESAAQIAELQTLLGESEVGWWGLWPELLLELGIFTDLATGRPADALARVETMSILPKCLAAGSIPDEYLYCPSELVRAYQELGDNTAAQDLGLAIVQRAKLFIDGWPHIAWQARYASGLAVTGRTDEALDFLETMVASGWRGYYPYFLRFTLYFDVTFDAIRGDERFQTIVATIEADMAQQLENVREMQRRGEVPTLEELKAQIARNQAASIETSDASESTLSRQ